jgi:hypothetical protein
LFSFKSNYLKSINKMSGKGSRNSLREDTDLSTRYHEVLRPESCLLGVLGLSDKGLWK